VAGWLESASTWLVDNHWAPWLFALLLFLAFAEAAFFLGFVIPGETALLVGGALCATGVFPLAAFLPAAVIAAIAGDSVGYEVGHRYGPRLRGSRLGARIGPERWLAAEAFFHRHGGKAVFLGRSQALLRAMVPAMAGASRLPYRTFLPWNALGGLVWGGGMVLLGYAFGHSLGRIETGLKYWTLGVLAVLASLVVWWHLRHRRARRARRAQQDETADSKEAA
jgi:membrane protein DedA with SNARE-associated domain